MKNERKMVLNNNEGTNWSARLLIVSSCLVVVASIFWPHLASNLSLSSYPQDDNGLSMNRVYPIQHPKTRGNLRKVTSQNQNEIKALKTNPFLLPQSARFYTPTTSTPAQSSPTLALSMFTIVVSIIVIYSLITMTKPRRAYDVDEQSLNRSCRESDHNHGPLSKKPRYRDPNWVWHLIKRHGSGNVSRAIRLVVEDLEKQRQHIINRHITNRMSRQLFDNNYSCCSQCVKCGSSIETTMLQRVNTFDEVSGTTESLGKGIELVTSSYGPISNKLKSDSKLEEPLQEIEPEDSHLQSE